MESNLTIEGLSCGHCVNAVEQILKAVKGVESVSVKLPDEAKVTYNENIVTLNELKQAVNSSEIYKAV